MARAGPRKRVYDDNWVLFPVAWRPRAGPRPAPSTTGSSTRASTRMLAWDVGDGWYSDGDGHAFDRYTGWAVHWHLLHWAAIDGDRRPEVRDRVIASAATWLRDLPAWCGRGRRACRSWAAPWATSSRPQRSRGSPRLQGVLPIDPGLARGIIDRNIRYHLDHDAIDPATDWFRVGIWGGAAGGARAVHARGCVGVGGARAGAARAAVRTTRSGPPPTRACPATGARPIEPAVDLVLRGSGYLVGPATRVGAGLGRLGAHGPPRRHPGTRLPADLRQVAVPLRLPADPDGRRRTTRTGRRYCWSRVRGGGIGHRGLVDDGGVGPDWTWTRHGVVGKGGRHDVTTVSIRSGDIWVRATGLRPRTRPGGGGQPAAGRGRRRAPSAGPRIADARMEAATDGGRWVAIRALAGFDRAVPSGPARGGADVNLVEAYSEQPTVSRVPSPPRRPAAGPRGRRPDGRSGPAPRARGDRARGHRSRHGAAPAPDGRGRPARRGRATPAEVTLGGWTFHGPALHVVRVGPDGAWLAAESVIAASGAFRAASAGARRGPPTGRRPCPRRHDRVPSRSMPGGRAVPGAVCRCSTHDGWSALGATRTGQASWMRDRRTPPGADGSSVPVAAPGRPMSGGVSLPPGPRGAHVPLRPPRRPAGARGRRVRGPRHVRGAARRPARHAAVVSWAQVAAAMTGGPALPPDAVLLTFDDGEDDHHRYVLPMLRNGASGGLLRDGPRPGGRAHRGPSHPRRARVALARQLREAVLDRLSPDDRARFLAAEAAQARHPFTDPVDDLKWVLQRDLADAASPILSHLVEQLAGPEPDVAEALHLDARQVADLHAAGMTLGGHTRDHVWLDFVEPVDARARWRHRGRSSRRSRPRAAGRSRTLRGHPRRSRARSWRRSGSRPRSRPRATDRTDRWRTRPGGRGGAGPGTHRPSRGSRPRVRCARHERAGPLRLRGLRRRGDRRRRCHRALGPGHPRRHPRPRPDASPRARDAGRCPGPRQPRRAAGRCGRRGGVRRPAASPPGAHG